MDERRRHSFGDARFTSTVAHDGRGTIEVARATTNVPGSACTFIDLCVVPAGNSIGMHAHGIDDEEIYVVIDGHGSMTVDDETFDVGPGDVIVNRPGGAHGLSNDTDAPLRIVVVDIATPD
jgi:oxalate decarboxylase/phosphoglucose isomerase-like protein (cupin superfamily)